MSFTRSRKQMGFGAARELSHVVSLSMQGASTKRILKKRAKKLIGRLKPELLRA